MRALVEVIVCLPVYRTYVDGRPETPDAEDKRILRAALDGARSRGRADPGALDMVEAALLGNQTRRPTWSRAGDDSCSDFSR